MEAFPINSTISFLVDTTHQNLVIPDSIEFQNFFDLLESQGYHIHETKLDNDLQELDTQIYRAFLIGVPNTIYYRQVEIHKILSYVRSGGSLLIFHRYGGDILQKTNLNDLTSHFGIYFENTLLMDSYNLNLETIPIVKDFGPHPIMTEIRKLIFPGACTMRTSKDAHILAESRSESWINIFNPGSLDWSFYKDDTKYTVAAYAIYGQGRIIALSTPDLISNEVLFGLETLDHRQFILNIIKWLLNPVSELEVRDWMLQQLGALTESVSLLNITLQNLHKNVSSIETRLRDLEFKYYKLEGIHLPTQLETLNSAKYTDLTELSELLKKSNDIDNEEEE